MSNLTKKQIKHLYPNAFISEDVIIDESAVIGKHVVIGAKAMVIEGAVIGQSARIGAGARIGLGAVVGAWATIGPDVFIRTRAVIDSDARICAGAVIGENAHIKRGNEGIVVHGAYKYTASCYYCSRVKAVIIRLGCYHRTIDEWDSDFDNNLATFPVGAYEWQRRKSVYEYLKSYALNFEWDTN